MIDQQIEFFNVDELLPVEGLPGLRLYRYPKALAESLGEPWQHNARFRAQRVHGCEPLPQPCLACAALPQSGNALLRPGIGW